MILTLCNFIHGKVKWKCMFQEALKLHVVDSSEEPVSLAQRTPEGPLQETTDTAENGNTVVIMSLLSY